MNVANEIIASRAAWLGWELKASTEWIYRLGKEEAAEIDAAFCHLKGSGQAACCDGNFRRRTQHFDLGQGSYFGFAYSFKKWVKQ